MALYYNDMAEAEAVAQDLVQERTGNYEAEEAFDDATGEFLGWSVVQRGRDGGWLSYWPDAPEPDYS